MGGGDETQARPVIVDQAGVSLPNKGDNLYVTSSDAEVADLLCEGIIEGIVSGKYTYEGNVNQTGYNKTGFAHYHATGIGEDPDNDIDLGFLQSVYWNDVPVVDANGFYNFTNINIEYVKGTPAGDLPALNSKLPASETLDLSVLRNIGERLYGISTQGGSSSTETTPSDKIVTDAAIDTVAKTYTILNKECSKIQVRIKVAGLFENIRSEDAPKTYEDSKELRKGHVASTGYGDTKARSIEYWIYFKPLFDQRFITVASDDESQEVEVKNIKWSSPRKEVIEGKIEQIYIRNTTIDLKSDYVYDPSFAGWTIKIIRITPESLTTYLRNQTYVDSIVEIYGTKLRHPYSSMVYSKFDAEFFTRVPARSYDTKLIKVHVPNNYDPIKKTYGISDAIDVNQLDREGNIDLNAIWPQSVKVKSRLRSGQVVKFEGGGKFTLTQNTPDITYPTNFYQEPNTHSLLHFDGANDATSTSDSSTYQIPISLNGSAKLSTTQEKFEPSSLYLDGTGDSATLGASDGTSFAWSNSSWGIECWVRPDSGSLSADRMIFDSAGVIYLQTNTAGKVVLRAKDETTDNQFLTITTTQALTAGTWHHIAAVRNGNDFKIYIDGSSYANATFTNTIKTAGAASTIGEYEQGGAGLEQYFKGYIDEFRITIGEAPYTADFTPETAAFPDPYEITNYGTLNGTVHLDETGATTEGYSEGTDDDNFWDGGFKQIENWTGGNDSKPKGDAQITKEWTDNPAWGFYDLLTNPRYGLGDYIDKCQVDKWALYEIAQYCDVLVDDGYGGIEPRFTMNHIITSREEAYKVINDLSSVFRGIAYYSSGLIQPVQDAYKKPVYQFNNTNVVEGNFTYASSAKKTRHSVALVRYINKRDFYKPAVEYVEDEEAVKRYGIREIQTTALGSTSRGQARRFGIWLLASEFEETETVSFSVGQDGAYLKPGDIFQVYDQYRTPLKFGGRTNDVGGLGVAPDSVSYTNQNLPPPAVCYNPAYTNQTACENAGEAWLEQDGSVTGNSVTIDNAVSFVGNQVYKFSLLTPTYSYDAAQISDMTSDEISEIRRPQIQNLYFMGAHTRTVTGAYNSDYQQAGSGICTQIYFHTGLELTDGTLVGSENQLDFDNYVITGYTNNYIQGPDGDIRESYSGGCFSGQNLIWSLEPNDPTNPEVISGNFSNYRAINIAENDDNSTYSISALAYSTGKYSSVESRMSYVSPTYSLPIHWPYIDVGGVKKTKDAYSIIKGYPQELNEPEGEIINNMGQGFLYPTVEVRFPEAGTELVESAQGEDKRFSVDPNSTNPSNTTYLICHHAASPTEAGFGLISIANAATLFSSEGTTLYEVSTANFSKFTLDSQNRSREYFIVPGHYYDVNNPEDEDGKKIFSQYIDQTKEPQTVPPLLVSYFFEALLQKDANHWFAIFALNNDVRSKNAVIGLIPGTNYNGNTTPPAGIKDNQLEQKDVYTQIKLISINNLTTQNLKPVDALKLNRLESTEPTFTWDIGEDPTTYDDQNDELFIPIPYNDYRITIREHTDSPVPSDYIYIELTGQVNPSTEGSFTFYKEYNNPNTIVSLGEHTDPNITRYDANGEITDEINETEWFRSDTSGILLRNVPNKYPIREFDIVVEAHDSNGITSVGGDNGVGHVWNNTILPLGTEGYSATQNGFDKLGAQLAVPSGITFGYSAAMPSRAGVKKQFLTSEEAYNRRYPYLATAAVYTDGTLSLSFEPSIDAAGNRIISENSLRDTFSDVAGIVYYYTTGDNTVIDVIKTDEDGKQLAEIEYLPNNEAPFFELETTNVLAAKVITVNESEYTNLDLGFQGNARFDDKDGVYQNWDYDGDTSQVPAVLTNWVATDTNTKFKYARIHRNYYVLPGNVNPGDIRIPFPKIGHGAIQNIRLTLAFFDNLSLAQHFTSDGRPKIETINNPKTKLSDQEIPTIFGDNSMAFSTIPQQLFGDNQTWYEGTDGDGEIFTEKAGHPMLLREQSVLAESELALHYRAWFDITIDPGEGPWFTAFAFNLWCFESYYWNGNSLNFNADFDYRYNDKDIGKSWNPPGGSYDQALPIAWDEREGDDLPFWWNSSASDLGRDQEKSRAFATYRGPHRPNMSSSVKKDDLHARWGGEPKDAGYLTDVQAGQPNGGYTHGDAPPTYYSINSADPVVTRRRESHKSSSVLHPPKVKLKGFSSIKVSDIKINPDHQFAQSCYVTLYLEKELDPNFYSVDVEFYQSNMSSPLVTDGSATNINLRDLAPSDFPVKSYVCEKTEKHVKFFLSPFYVGGNSSGGVPITKGIQKEMEDGKFILHYVSQEDVFPNEKRHSWVHIPKGVFEIDEFFPEDYRTDSGGKHRIDYWYITKIGEDGVGDRLKAKTTIGPVPWKHPNAEMGPLWPTCAQGDSYCGDEILINGASSWPKKEYYPRYWKVAGASVSATHDQIPPAGQPLAGNNVKSTGVRQGNIIFSTTSTDSSGYTGSNSASSAAVVNYLKTKFPESNGDISSEQKLLRFNGGFNPGDNSHPDGKTYEQHPYSTHPNFLGNIIRMKGGILYSEEVYGK